MKVQNKNINKYCQPFGIMLSSSKFYDTSCTRKERLVVISRIGVRKKRGAGAGKTKREHLSSEKRPEPSVPRLHSAEPFRVLLRTYECSPPSNGPLEESSTFSLVPPLFAIRPVHIKQFKYRFATGCCQHSKPNKLQEPDESYDQSFTAGNYNTFFI